MYGEKSISLFVLKITHTQKKELLFSDIYKLFILSQIDGMFLSLWEE